MPKGKRRCELGKDCPYQHEHQHQWEFTHDDSPAKAAKPRSPGAAGEIKGKRKVFEGVGVKLASGESVSKNKGRGVVLGSAADEDEDAAPAPRVKKPRKAGRAAAEAAMRRFQSAVEAEPARPAPEPRSGGGAKREPKKEGSEHDRGAQRGAQKEAQKGGSNFIDLT